MSDNPLCFVLMPFGTKKDPTGGPDINFDSVYEKAIRPAIEDAGMDPIRADEELTGGIIQKPMFERLLLCEFALADLTTANPNVFYELGVRHAARPATTLAIFAKRQSLPFDIAYLRSLPYDLGEDNRFSVDEASALRNTLTRRLKELRQVAVADSASDSPIFQLLTDYGAPDIQRLKTDVFRDRVRYATGIKRELAEARQGGDVNALKAIEGRLGALDGIEAGVLVDLFVSYRAVRGYTQMVELYAKLPAVLRRSVLVREQLGFALNRLGKWREALSELEGVVDERGASSETCGLIGRVYKDRWVGTRKAGNTDRANGFLDKAIDAYMRGFETDWRDAYPGINVVTLLDIRGDERSQKRKAEILPVVRFAVTQRLKSSKPDYWDYATLLELAVLEGNQEMSKQYLSDALANMRETWEPENDRQQPETYT
ncbi:MAG TPA: TRAFs-binding domain-containing protein [Candidatus Angelobacter sp.]|nr:TRAFs-binding domain-containing protein [Candidatus Angelobacter sp.]